MIYINRVIYITPSNNMSISFAGVSFLLLLFWGVVIYKQIFKVKKQKKFKMEQGLTVVQ